MMRYYVEFDDYKNNRVIIYMMAYSPDHVRQILPEYTFVAIDQTD